MKKTISLALLSLLVITLASLLFFRSSLPAQPNSLSDAVPAPAEPDALPSPVPEETVSDETDSEEPVPEISEPDLIDAQFAVSGLGILSATADRGDRITLLSRVDDRFIRASVDGLEYCVEDRLVRLSGDAAPAPSAAYARNGTEIYASPYLTGEPLAVLSLNTVLDVQDSFGGISLVSCGDVTGYADSASLSPSKIVSHGGGGSKGKSGGNDGGDIVLSFRCSPAAFSAVPLSLRSTAPWEDTGSSDPVFPCEAVILADGTELYSGVTLRGEALKLSELDEAECLVYSPGVGTLPRWAVLTVDDSTSGPYIRYAKKGAKLYHDYRLCGDCTELSLNTELSVLLEIEAHLYYVCIGEEEGFLSMDSSSEKRIIFSGGSGSGSSGGSGGSWSPPAL